MQWELSFKTVHNWLRVQVKKEINFKVVIIIYAMIVMTVLKTNN